MAGPVKYLETLGSTAMLGGVLALIMWANEVNYMVAPAIIFFGVGALLIAKAIKKDDEKVAKQEVDNALKGIPELEYGTVQDGKLHYKHAHAS